MTRLLLVAVVTVAVAATGAPAAGSAPAPAPKTAGVTLGGKRLALADLRGRPVLINVWSSW
jgi:hypothetical protein